MRARTTTILILLWLVLPSGGYAQDSAASAGNGQASQPSLGDIARAYRTKREPSVEVTQRDAKELFASINEILAFASRDSGMPQKSTVKYQLIGKDEADRHFTEALKNGPHMQRLLRTQLVLKDFGLLPPDFDLQKNLLQAGASGLAGYYDPRTKTMNLLNWIDLDQQRAVMAHELTHALQDQNYDLIAWRNAGSMLGRQTAMQFDSRQANESMARIAVVEGQAMVVYVDYLLKPWGHSLGDSPQALDRFENRLMAGYDSPVVVHNAPRILKETTIFPYVDGLAFEIELLKKGGRRLAFAGAFLRPPRDTHEIMDPDDYIARRRSPSVVIPDLSGALGKGYQPYDAGIVGALDVRIMAEQFGRENDPYLIAPAWDGGAYIAVKKLAAAGKPDAQLSPADLGLVYVSRWKSAEAVKRFAQLYEGALSQRSKILTQDSPKAISCPQQAANCNPVWAAHLTTDQGLVSLEIWPGNMLLITQGLDEASLSQVRSAALHPNTNEKRAALEQPELSGKLLVLPQMQALQMLVGRQVRAALERSLQPADAPLSSAH